MAKDAQRADVERDLLVDINVVTARLGVEVRHIRRLVHERRIPYVKWGTSPDSTPPKSTPGSKPLGARCRTRRSDRIGATPDDAPMPNPAS